jgi:hypothetical protein
LNQLLVSLRWTVGIAVVAVVLLTGASSRAADTTGVQVGATADTFVRALAPNTNEGSLGFLRVTALGENRALVQVDESSLEAAVGAGSLDSAQLRLQIVRNGNDWGQNGGSVSIYRLTVPWAEGDGADLRLPTLGPRGNGTGATWQCAVDTDISNLRKDCSGATGWTMSAAGSGQPWAAQPTATAAIANGQTGTVSFDLTADVTAFLLGTALNDGWIIKKNVDGGPGLVEFGSRESATPPALALQVETNGQPAMNVTQPYTDPTLTDDQASAAVAAVQNDPSFTALTSGLSYTITDVHAWGFDAQAGLAGAIVDVTLESPARIAGSWPEFIYNGDDQTPLYDMQSFNWDLSDVTSITGYVNLSSDSVVGLDPNPDAIWTDALQGNSNAPVHQARMAKHSSALQQFAVETEDPNDTDPGRGTNKLQPECPDGLNCFMNFDFSTKAQQRNSADWNLVDWPVDMIWRGGDINFVKNYIGHLVGWFETGSSMAAALYDGGQTQKWGWDTDKGRKEGECTFHNKSPHTRLYAPSDSDEFFSPPWGFYVIGTTHFDWGECLKYGVKVVTLDHFGGGIGGAG